MDIAHLGFFLIVALGLMLVVCFVMLLIRFLNNFQANTEREELQKLLAEMVNERAPARRLPPLRPPTPSMGMSPKEEIDYLKEAIEQRQTPRPDPPKPGRLS